MRASCSALGSVAAARRAAAGAVAQFQLRQHGLQLLVGDLLLQTGDLGQSIQLAQVAGERGNLNVVLLLGLLGFDRGAQRFGRGLPCLGATAKIEERKLNLESRAEVVGRDEFGIVVLLEVVQTRRYCGCRARRSRSAEAARSAVSLGLFLALRRKHLRRLHGER